MANPGNPLIKAFALTPAEAVDYMAGRAKLRPTTHWTDLWHDAHQRAFTVSRVTQMDVLQDIFDAVDKAVKEGRPYGDFAGDLEQTLRAKGWWGVKEVVDPDTGEVFYTKFNPRRLDLIYRQNMAVAYQAGRWGKHQALKKRRPYLMYDAVNDDRTRPEHLAWDGVILPVDDSWWDTHYPPNGWDCRCGCVSLSQKQLERKGLAVSGRPPQAFYEWKNPRTGETTLVPKGIDPGWDYNPGKTFSQPDGHIAAAKVYPVLIKAAVEKSKKLFSPPKNNGDVRDILMGRAGHLSPHGIKSMHFTSVLPIPGGGKKRGWFMATNSKGDFWVNNIPQKSLNFKTDDELRKALQAMAKGKDLSYHEECALEMMWHEIMHNRQVLQKDPMAAFENALMETTNEWCSRRTYQDLLHTLANYQPQHQSKITASGYGYQQSVGNFDKLLKALGLTDADVLQEILHIHRTVDRSQYADPLAQLLADKSGSPQKKAALLNILKKLNNADVEALLKGQ